MFDKESQSAQMTRQDIEKVLGVETQTYLFAEFPTPAQIDDLCVERIASAMKEKLSRKRTEGRGRWWDSSDCKSTRLQKMLRDHVQKGDPIDVMNIAMMLYCRGERTSLPGFEPLFWYRPVGEDGGYEGPIHANSEEFKSIPEDKRNQWVPLIPNL